MLKLIGIKVKDKGFFITNNLDNSYSTSHLGSYFINGETPQPSFHKSWFRVESEPKSLQQTVTQPNTNERYELRDKSLSDKFKEVYFKKDVFLGWDDNEAIWDKEFDKVRSLYEFKSDAQPSILKEIDFEYETILDIDNIEDSKNWSYPTYGQYGEASQTITQNNAKYRMIDEILTPSLLIHNKPCKLTKQESFDIVRAWVKDHIDPRVSSITSDYDFCLTVTKRVPLAKPVEYQVDINNSIFSKRKKKPKFETRINKTKDYKVYHIAPKSYQSYNVIEEFEGESQEDLQRNIQSYLDEVMAVINQPFKECSCCGGVGHVLSEESK